MNSSNLDLDDITVVYNLTAAPPGLDDGSRMLYLVAVPLMLTCLITAFIFNTIILVCCVTKLSRPYSQSLSFSVSLVAAAGYSAFYLSVTLTINSLLAKVYLISMEPYRCVQLFLEVLKLSSILTAELHILLWTWTLFDGIRNPIRFRTSTDKRHRVLYTIMGMWIGPFIAFMVAFSVIPGQGFQSEKCLNVNFMMELSFHVAVSGTFLIPLFLTFLLYLVIYHRLRSAQKQGNSIRSSCHHRGSLNKSRKMLKTTLMVFTSIVFFCLPLIVQFLLVCNGCLYGLADIQGSQTFLVVSSVNNILFIMKTLVDPIIYATRMGEIKRAVKRTFCPQSRGNSTRYGSLITRQETIVLRTFRHLHSTIRVKKASHV